MPSLSPARPSPVIGRVVFVVLALAAAGMICAALGTWKLWVDARTQAEQDAHNLSVVLAEQTGRSLQAVGLILNEVEATIRAEGVKTPEEFRTFAASSASLHRMLADRIATIPQAFLLSVIAKNGDLVNSSRSWPVPNVNLANRDFVRYCNDSGSQGTFISETVRNQADDRPVFFLARCITASDGTYLGVLTSALRVDYLMAFYRNIGLPPGDSVVIRRADGTALVAYPSLVAAGDGRFVASHPLADLPIIAEVGTSRHEALRLWRQQVTCIICGSACALVGMLFLLNRLVAVLRRFEHAQRALMERHRLLAASRLRQMRQARELADKAAELRDSEARLAGQTSLLETTLEHMNQGLMVVDGEHRVVICNQRAIAMLDLPPELMARRPWFSEVIAFQQRLNEFSASSDQVKEFIQRGGILDQEHTYERKRPDGTVIEIHSKPLAGGGVVRTYTDVTDRHQVAERLSYAAFHDELTGLANRHVLRQALEQALETTPDGLAVLYLDLDRFKLVNDTRGHAIGDRLLIDVARRMQDSVRAGDVVVRLGGDEFAVLLPAGTGHDAALGLANRLKTAVRAPYELDGTALRIGVSIGIARYPNDGVSADDLLRNADAALYRAKATGRDAVCCYEPSAEAETRGRLILEQELRQALDAEQFELEYQPIYDMVAGMPTSIEALIRWNHPVLGRTPPDRFIPIAEETGIINPMSQWVLQMACREAATWATPARVAVNLSPKQFAQPDLEEQVLSALRSSGLPASRLELEVTESVLINDADTVRATMTRLQAHGVRFVLDDFGTGHASLDSLRRLPFQQFKIDRAFVANVDRDERAAAILRAMLELARNMDLDVVVEGVETSEQMDMLRQLGTRWVQGYFISRPQSPERTRDMLWRCTIGRSEEFADARELAVG